MELHTEAGEAKLAGNSVHVDAQFLRRHMPLLFRHLSHRIVDVSSLAELCMRWYPREFKRAPKKKVKHSFYLKRIQFILQKIVTTCLKWYTRY